MCEKRAEDGTPSPSQFQPPGPPGVYRGIFLHNRPCIETAGFQHGTSILFPAITDQ